MNFTKRSGVSRTNNLSIPLQPWPHGCRCMCFQPNSTVSGRNSPLRETANVGPAAFTGEEEGPPFGMHATPEEGPSPPDHPGGKQLVLYQPLPFGMTVQDTGCADDGESRDGGSARAVVSDAMGTSAWVPEGPPSHIAGVNSDDGAEDELHLLPEPLHAESVTLETVLDSAQPGDNGLSSARDVSPALVRWNERRITQPHPAVVGVVSANIAGALVMLLCQWRARRTRLRQQALDLARQDALRRVMLRDADRSRQREVSVFWCWRLATSAGFVVDLRAQRDRAAAEHEAARAADREAAQERQEAAVGVVTAVETGRRESAETALDEAREAAATNRAEQEARIPSTEESLVETRRELRETRQGVTEFRGVVEELQQQLKNIEVRAWHQRQRKQFRYLAAKVETKQLQVAATTRALTEARRDGESLARQLEGQVELVTLSAAEGRAGQAVAKVGQLEGQVEELGAALEAASRGTAAEETATARARAEAEEL
ncbi:unnamed protein product [Ectocarpus sp. 13 AM-2016]